MDISKKLYVVHAIICRHFLKFSAVIDILNTYHLSATHRTHEAGDTISSSRFSVVISDT